MHVGIRTEAVGPSGGWKVREGAQRCHIPFSSLLLSVRRRRLNTRKTNQVNERGVLLIHHSSGRHDDAEAVLQQKELKYRRGCTGALIPNGFKKVNIWIKKKTTRGKATKMQMKVSSYSMLLVLELLLRGNGAHCTAPGGHIGGQVCFQP